MGGPLQAAGRGVLRALGLWPLFVIGRQGPLREDGWFRSFAAGEAVDADGRPLPWLAYPAIEFLARRVRPEMRVFEYGCGSGTLWWAARVAEVVACEHDRDWYERIRARVPAHVTLRHAPLEYGGDYARCAAAYPGRFDLVVVDGRDRVNCAKAAVTALAPGGVIVWDNSDRPQYRPGHEHLAGLGFRKLPFVGLAPAQSEKIETAIYYRPDNCLGI